MNNLTTYEQLIADKLQQLPVPDMADAIWARIEQRLNVEMPLEDGGNNTGSSSLPGFQFPGKGIVFLFLAALVSVLFYLNYRPTKQGQKNHTPSNTNTISIPVQDIYKTPEEKSAVQPAESMYTDKADLPIQYSRGDSFDTQIPASSTEPISIINEKATLPKSAPVITIGQSIIPKNLTPIQDSGAKKGRGVKGIGTDDYRIVPVKKDSL
ncbi:MAG: hypothetical protein ACN4EP_14390 [Sediminibacterium sp.]